MFATSPVHTVCGSQQHQILFVDGIAQQHRILFVDGIACSSVKLL
jgi:hypothetical protein